MQEIKENDNSTEEISPAELKLVKEINDKLDQAKNLPKDDFIRFQPDDLKTICKLVQKVLLSTSPTTARL